MNILHHKSWHVRTKKNIARVRRDEEKAKKNEQEKQQKINFAENEARINQLMREAGVSNKDIATTSKSTKCFDLFEDYQNKIVHREKEIEKKKEQEKWEVNTGIFSYLDGRYKHEKTANNEWYLKSHEERLNLDSNSDSKYFKDERTKLLNDPLEDMKQYLSVMNKNKKTSDSAKLGSKTKSEIKPEKIENEIKQKSRHKKHRKRKHQNASSDDETSTSSDASKKLIEKLRAERLARENKERQRTMILLHGPSDNSSTKTNEVIGQVKRKYNSQFNPHLARQNFIDS